MARRRQGTLFRRSGRTVWIARWYDHAGRQRERSTKTSDRLIAELVLAKYLEGVVLRKHGVVDGRLDDLREQERRPIAKHVQAFRTKTEAAGRKPKHVATTIGYIEEIIEAASWGTAPDIHADHVHSFVQGIRDKGRSARTVQARLTAIKAFTRWLVHNDKLARDPLASVTKPTVKADRRLERRMLLPDEWQWLEAVTMQSPPCYGMTGSERALLYAVAIQTGLRQSELRALTRGRLHLAGGSPFILAPASATKNAKDAKQHVNPELAARLAAHVRTKSPKAPVFAMPAPWAYTRMLRGDLAAAREKWLQAGVCDPGEHARLVEDDFLLPVNHDGARLDFHSLRHTCGAWLAMTGAHPKAVQAVMRHSSITLTMDTYGHLFPGQDAESVRRLSGYMEGSGSEALAATGTDCGSIGAPLKRHSKGCETTRRGANGCEMDKSICMVGKAQKSLENKAVSDAVRRHATECDTAPPGTRTPDPLIKSQLLCQLS